jgi:glucose-1-phosphate thymidylyltransferase
MTATQIDKAVILAGGLGTRMRREDESAALDDDTAAVAETGIKAMIPVGRPFLDYLLSALADTGYRRVCLVVGPGPNAVREHYGERVQPQRLSIEFAVQQEPKGTADAVAASEAFAGDDDFIVLNSDDFYPPQALAALRQQEGFAVALFEWQSMLAGSNIPQERLRRFAVGCINGSGMLRKILEKPDEKTWNSLPRPLWMSMNCWRFGPEIFQACRAIEPSPRGELEITDAAQYIIDVVGKPFRAVTVRAPVLDMTGRQDIAPIRERLAAMEVNL